MSCVRPSLLTLCALLECSIAFLACSRTPPTSVKDGREQPQAARAIATRPEYLGVERCYNAWDDNENGRLDEGCSVPQAAVAVMLAWADDEADLDLIVADPSGEIATSGAPTKSGLAAFLDCPDDEGCGAQSYEMALVEDETYAGGRYQVQVLARKFASRSAPLVAQLGIVTPEGSSAYRLEFFDLGQSVTLDFVVAEPTQIE